MLIDFDHLIMGVKSPPGEAMNIVKLPSDVNFYILSEEWKIIVCTRAKLLEYNELTKEQTDQLLSTGWNMSIQTSSRLLTA